MPKEQRKPSKSQRGALADDLHADRYAMLRREATNDYDGKDERGASGGFLVPNKQTQKILKAAREQIELEDAGDHEHLEVDEEFARQIAAEEAAGLAGGAGSSSRARRADVEGEDDNDGDDEEGVELEYDDHESEMTEAQDFGDLEEEYEIDEEESRLLAKFQPATGLQSRNLADIIMEKIREKEMVQRALQDGAAAGGGGDGDGEDSEFGGPRIDKRVAKVYYAIGGVLKHYRSGKIPKAFKVLPHVQNWEQLLMITKPYEWSPHATYAATRIFAAGLNEKMAQRFYSAILMPIVHDAMAEAKKLHPSLYMAIRKALYKPIAFYKGFLLPLIMEGECSLREALVVASVLQKMHLPPVPTAVALVKIAQLPFSSVNCVFLRVLIDKKMALPMQAIDALVVHFHKFIASHKDETLPVLWHQTFLSFIQRYKHDLTPPQMELMHRVCVRHFHHLITPEVRRELAAAQGKKNWLE